MSMIYRDQAGRVVPASQALEANGLIRDGYSMSDILADGERLTMPVMLMDSALRQTAFLRDAAGAPITLYDHATGGRMKLTDDHIAAIQAEADKAGLTPDAYVRDVLRYSTTL